jgi:hypothetical protein
MDKCNINEWKWKMLLGFDVFIAVFGVESSLLGCCHTSTGK